MASKPSTSRTQDGAENVFAEFVEESKRRKIQNRQILKYQPGYQAEKGKQYSMHCLSNKYNVHNDVQTFLNNIAHLFSEVNVKYIEKQTKNQHQAKLWHHLRFARSTASKAHEVSRGKTADGSRIGLIMGGRLPDTKSIKRGRNLEASVRGVLEKN